MVEIDGCQEAMMRSRVAGDAGAFVLINVNEWSSSDDACMNIQMLPCKSMPVLAVMLLSP